MGRTWYSSLEYRNRLETLADTVTTLGLGADIIVGFPGETEEDFEETLQVVAEARYDQAFTFLFSPRPGTAAAELTDLFVDPDVAQDRYERLIAVQNRVSLEKNQEEVGRVLEILVEGPSRKDPEVITARSRGNKVVHVPGHHDPGTFLQARIEGAARHHLLGAVL